MARKKGGHGGKRAGAGRATLPKTVRHRIGAEAETIIQTERTPLRYPDIDYDEIESARAEARRGDPHALEYVTTELDHRKGRRATKSLRLPHNEVYDRLAAKHGITRRQVRRWRQEYLDTKR